MVRARTSEIDAPSSCCSQGARRDALPPSTTPARIVPQAPSVARGVPLPGGRVPVGTDRSPLPQDGEGPLRRVNIKPFAIEPYAVTNDWFADFVAKTGYRTDAERYGWSLVFAAFVPPDVPAIAAREGPPWWRRVEGACWQHPEGAGTGLEQRRDHPVVHVSWNDARAFAAWAGGRLPSEAEWEYAAAGGITGARFPWGEREPDDVAFQPCNIWQGDFPGRNVQADGYAGTAPVAAFAPNGYGLYNMVGNTWEWCDDIFRVRSLARAARQRNAQAQASGERLLKGGSYLCHRSYCYRYRIAARTGVGADSSTGHVGFRLVFDP